MKKLLTKFCLLTGMIGLLGVANANAWYWGIAGADNGWSTTANLVEYASGAAGTATLKLDQLTGQFKIIRSDGSNASWYNTINLTLPSGVSFDKNNNDGNYQLSENLINVTITFNLDAWGNNCSGVTIDGTVSTEFIYPELYIVGGQPGWGPNDDYKMTQTDGIYTLAYSGDFAGEFKIASDGWVYSYGGTSGNNATPVTPGESYTLNNNGGSSNLIPADSQTWKNPTFTFNFETNTLVVTAQTQENEYDCIYVIGDYGYSDGWDANLTEFPLNLQEGSNNTYVGSFIPTKGESMFKLKAGNNLYGVAEGGTQVIELNKELTATFNVEPSFIINNGTYTLTFVLDKNAETGKLTVTGTASFPETLYLLGSGINGESYWDEGVALTTGENGIYTWEGTSLATGFKITNGSWNTGYNIGSTGEGNTLSLDTPFTINNNENSADINFEKLPIIHNPKLTLNLAEETLTITGERPLYLIGSMTKDDEGNDWQVLESNMFTKSTSGDQVVYTLSGIEAISSTDEFKIGPADWSSAYSNQQTNLQVYNELLANEYTLNNDLGYTNMGMAYDVTNATLTLTMSAVNAETGSLKIEGTFTSATDWSASVGSQDGEVSGDSIEITTEEETATIYVTAPADAAKVYYLITSTVAAASLEENGYTEATKGSGNTYEIPVSVGEGTISLYFLNSDNILSNEKTLTYKVIQDTESGVAGIEAENGEAVYFNLQGVKVANPQNGVFVKVANGKAVKVVVND